MWNVGKCLLLEPLLHGWAKHRSPNVVGLQFQVCIICSYADESCWDLQCNDSWMAALELLCERPQHWLFQTLGKAMCHCSQCAGTFLRKQNIIGTQLANSRLPIHCDALFLHLQKHSIYGGCEIDGHPILDASRDLDIEVLILIFAVGSKHIMAKSREIKCCAVKCLKVEITPSGTYTGSDCRALNCRDNEESEKYDKVFTWH